MEHHRRVAGMVPFNARKVNMGLIFKKEHIDLVLKGIKTQTRRRHQYPLKAEKIYDIKKDWYHKTGHKILITKVYRQRLGDITPEEAMKEGGYTVREFIEVWIRINGSWDPDEVVWIYEFKVIETPRLNGFLSGLF